MARLPSRWSPRCLLPSLFSINLAGKKRFLDKRTRCRKFRTMFGWHNCDWSKRALRHTTKNSMASIARFKVLSSSNFLCDISQSKLRTSPFKVIPLKLFYYQTFFETWRDEHSLYEHYKNAIKRWGHRACLRVSRLLKWGIFTGCALKVWITFIQN